MIDTIINEPGYNYIIDLQASLLNRFFKLFHDINLDEGAVEAGIGVAVFFMIDRSLTTLAAAKSVRDQLRKSEFVLVRNDAIGNMLHIPEAANEYLRIDKDRDLILPRLSDEARQYLETPGFTFADFIAGESHHVPANIRYEFWNFLETIYNQRKPGASGTTLLI
ncbi:MAG: hypothetical protein WBO55_03415 [Rhizobiaceae bacterium]